MNKIRGDVSILSNYDIHWKKGGDFASYIHASHAMIWTRSESILWKEFRKRASIMMQVRFDGSLGFPGGLIDESDETLEDGLNRELEEELKLDLNKHLFTSGDHVISHINHAKKLITHFYAKEITNEEEYNEVEKETLGAKDWGIETLGIVRVPLFTMSDGFRGLPLFLSNQFAGNSREQLTYTLGFCNILSEEEIATALESASRVSLSHDQFTIGL